MAQAAFALEKLGEAARGADGEAADAAYSFGRDSWNSYLVVINRAIVPKVGDRFVPIE